jgi:hypothetical protein
MAFRFIKASCVAVGAFNIYIVQPGWLTEKGLIPPGEMGLAYKLDEPGFMFRSPAQKVHWQVTPTRIVIETEDQAQDCGIIVADLLALLPETPISAVGNNAHYEEVLDVEEDIPHPGFPTEFPVVDPLPGFSLQQRSFHVGLGKEGCVYNVQVALTAKRAELLINAHRQIGKPEGGAREHARRFMEHRATCLVLAKHHLGVTVNA